ncbi:multifunctional cyclin-dependent kinase pho85-like protein [Leptomonas pyrrhocoris]|uniref:Multifunctional cyclin-dependent kinase pho85-like protein n=1 Tax=Leptomonas pyrrhocoris TaxID=157538 RepID=A0A0N0DW25_LEPPY|nr:multifunctional cyclin-dependent kinase pho85-like protein [Leptomonas pyrrhocoris]KPA81212.1 multifunctional cyclin-dependent kinase pho85-like protein [Leptomonas pyrrhocoris]|eukprot:XP_015659651.1 multifunctional cyclin-dependent kinase pho85-like protein [Leptomonas pyrrhocoris]
MSSMSVCVYGLSAHHLETFFAEEAVRRTQPLVASSAADLRFGLVGGARAFGSWGRGWPVVLERCRCQREPCALLSPSHPSEAPQPSHNINDFVESEHYVAHVDISAEELAGFQNGSSAGVAACDGDADECHKRNNGSFKFPCRLVILENAFFCVSSAANSSICATPGTVIAGVDQQHTMPSILQVTAVAPAAKRNSMDAGGTRVQWCGVLDVRPATTIFDAAAVPPPSTAAGDNSQRKMEADEAATVFFTSTGEQFVFLHNLPDLPPRPLVYPVERASLSSDSSCPAAAAAGSTEDIPPFCGCGKGGREGATGGEPGPLLALTFYANDPRLPYDRAAWVAGLTDNVREVVQYREREGKEPTPITTVFYVTDVRPIPEGGSCWCPSHLPMPAPLEQQLREVRKKRSPNSSAASPPASPASRVSSDAASSTPSAMHHHSHRDGPQRAPRDAALAASVAFLEKGWCVRPLRPAKPVLPDMRNTDDHGRPPLNSNRTQEAWTCLLNLRELEEFGIEVTIKVPYMVEGTVLHLKGTTVIFSGMLQSSTSGTLLLSVFCPAPAGTKNTELTSLWVKLYVQYLLIFPLGECATRGPLEVARSRETYARLTVPTLVGHRGLGKTYTRSPAICGAPPLIMKCNENTVPAFQAAHARGCAMVEFDVMLSADRVPVVIHDPVIELLALKRDDACAPRGSHEHAPVRAAVHKLSVSQLRDLHAQSCKTLGRVFPLKDMLAHHWESLVRLAAARTAKWTGRGDASSAAQLRHDPVIGSALMHGEDFPNGVLSLRQVLEQTPPSLRFNLEVKYPFQPRWDSNLFLQSDAFEVNGFVDAILRLVFEFADSGREITFNSFDPNICLALALKQSRFDVFFLSDTEELRDLKDYRSFYIEGAIQFATSQHFAGISMNAGTLLSAEDMWVLERIPETPIYCHAERGPVPTDFFNADLNPSYNAASASSFSGSYGRAMVAEMHRRHLKVWTWGGMNSYLYFTYAQATKMRVDGVIGDRMPVFSS